MCEPGAGEEQDEQGKQRLVGAAAVLSPVIEKEQSRRDYEERDGNDRVGESMRSPDCARGIRDGIFVARANSISDTALAQPWDRESERLQ